MSAAGHKNRSKALLLAGGLGTRLRPLTDTVPKCLVEIGGRPLLDYWFDALGKAGIHDALINTHHLAEPVRRFIIEKNRQGFHAVESYEPKLLGSAGTITANRSWADEADNIVIVYADNLSGVDLSSLLDAHRAGGAPMTMLLFHAPNPKTCGIAELDRSGRVIAFEEKPVEPKSDMANAGIYVVTASAWREIADLQAFDLGFDVLPRFVGRMRGHLHAGYHRDIGSLDALAAAQKDAPAIFGKPSGHIHKQEGMRQ